MGGGGRGGGGGWARIGRASSRARPAGASQIGREMGKMGGNQRSPGNGTRACLGRRRKWRGGGRTVEDILSVEMSRVLARRVVRRGRLLDLSRPATARRTRGRIGLCRIGRSDTDGVDGGRSSRGGVFRGWATIARRAGTAPRPHVRRFPLRGEPFSGLRRARAVFDRSRGEPRRVLRAVHPRVPLVGRPPPDFRRARRRGWRHVVGPHPRRPRRRPHQLHRARQDPGRPEPRRAPRGLPHRASSATFTASRRTTTGCPPERPIRPAWSHLPLPVLVPSSRRTPIVVPPRRTSPTSPHAATNTTGLTSSSATVARSSLPTSAIAATSPTLRRRRSSLPTISTTARAGRCSG